MEIHQIGGTFYDSNIYLLKTEKPLVIDTGTGFNNKDVLKRLGEIIEPKSIDTIILTHRHYDHTGGAEALQKALDAELFIHSNAAPALRSGDALTTVAQAFGKVFPKLEVKALNEGDVIDCGEIELKVIHTPGHSDCSIALFHEGGKTLFSGDTVYTDGGIGRWDLPTGSHRQLIASLERLAGIDVENLYPGHGPHSVGEGNEHISLGLRYAKSWA